MSNKKLIFIFLLIVFFFISFSTASAVELNDTAVKNYNDDLNEDNLLTYTDDEKIADASSEYTVQQTKYQLSQSGYYYGETKLHVSIINLTSEKGIEGKNVGIYVDNKLWKEVTTDSKGSSNVDFKKEPGTYHIDAKLLDGTGLKFGGLDVTISKIPTDFRLSQNSAYYKDTKLTFKLTNILTKKELSNQKIDVKFSNGKTVTLKTNSKGIASYNVPFKPGTYTVTGTTNSKHVKTNKISMKFTIGKTYLKVASNGFTTSYNSAKKLNIKLTNYFTNHVMKNTKVNLKVYTGKKYKTITLTTDSKGIARYDASQLNTGSHKIVIKNNDKYTDFADKSVNVKVTKAKLSISAPEITTNYNTAKNFKITVKNKESGKAMKNVKVTSKVYTGKKYKTYTLKTNKNGQAVISTANLNKSIHKVAISIKSNSNMNSATAKSTITITN